MKKVFAGTAAVILALFVVIMNINAGGSQQETKKSITEATSKDCHGGPNGGPCCKMKYGSNTGNNASQTGSGEKNCGHACCKDGKDGHAACKTSCTSAAGDKQPGNQPPKSNSGK